MSGMSSSDFHLLRAPIGPPEPPECWSWSSLQAWRRCPRQWWLTRAKYSNANSPYPQLMHAGTVEGILVHHVIEVFVRYAREAKASGVTNSQAIRSSFPARQVIREKLASLAKG
jgi:hypothetical protein